MSYCNLVMLSASIPQYKPCSSANGEKVEHIGEVNSEKTLKDIFG